MHGMEAAAVHAFKHDRVSAAVGDRDRDGDAGRAGLGDCGGRHGLGSLVGKALAVGDMHGVWLVAGVPILKVVSPRGTLRYELRFEGPERTRQRNRLRAS